jgi:hypothetical protein
VFSLDEIIALCNYTRMVTDAHLAKRPAPPAGAVDPRIARAEKWLCMLDGFSLLALWLCDALTNLMREPTDRTWNGPRMIFPFGFRPGRAYERFSRALRLCLMLQAKIGQEIFDLRAGRSPVLTEASAKTCEAVTRPEARSAEMGLGAGEDDSESLEKPERPEAPRREAQERFEDGPQFYKLLNGPLKDAIAAICADLGLKPDWSLWTDDGFPPPPEAGVETWDIFIRPETPIRPRRVRKGAAEPWPPHQLGDGDGAVWWVDWRRPRAHPPPPPLPPPF